MEDEIRRTHPLVFVLYVKPTSPEDFTGSETYPRHEHCTIIKVVSTITRQLPAGESGKRDRHDNRASGADVKYGFTIDMSSLKG